ncbi:hypothetical protein [Marinifilum caeruleilacunae]|uniref:MetA-pathway of phenol degradation n=1 Tax=Marinifilum caeruleilacunae TaxID=2499076 RepID=A0ABX1WRZ2_9BACT|nr:hypothetical protein [Marinifilum caeruleilacunae]NOU58771.1 hypothetical protein [Marinifilum caeruleilacunae]
MRKLLLILLIAPFAASASDGNRPSGARAFSLGNASVALFDEWSGFYNQAGLSLLKKKSFGAYYENRFSIKELSTKSLHLNFPGKFGTFAGSYSQFGFELYKESKIGIAYSRELGKNLWAGIQFNQHSKKLSSEFGSQSKYTFEIGLLAEISSNFYLGFHISNPNQEKFQYTDYDEPIPTIGRFGFSWKLSNGAMICSEIQKNLDDDLQVKAGIEYPIHKKLSLRVGVHNHPNSICLGLGFNFSHLKANIGFSRHPVLGYTPSADISFQF